MRWRPGHSGLACDLDINSGPDAGDLLASRPHRLPGEEGKDLAGADNLAVVSVAAAMARKPALIGYIPSGRSPLHFALSATGQYLYVSDSRAAQIQVVNVSTLP